MSQEYNGTLKKSRRARSQRNRPVLVTSSDAITAEEQTIQETASAEEIEETPAAEPETSSTSPASKGRRLPNFFSTVGKSEKEDNQKETDVVQARLARAIKGKASTTTGKTAAVTEEKTKESSKSETRAASTATTRTRPAQQGAFKTRYILGIAIYLFAANFIGTGLTLVLRQMHADVVLAHFTLFGGPISISSSTVLFLAILIIILVLLARFDLIPRSLAPASQNRTGGTSKSSETATRPAPSPIRQGVKGDDDDLYQEYRLSQRRSKKR